MVEVGSIQIGGSIQTAEIERGLGRVEKGFTNIETKGKSVNADFERMNMQSKRLARTLGVMAIAGAGALIAIAKGAPATAGAMAKIKVSAMKLRFAVGEALQDEFEAFSGLLNNIANWVNDHPDLFSAITKSIIGIAIAATVINVGGWVFKAFATFWGLLKGIAAWTGWSVLAGWFTRIAGLAKGVGTAIGGAVSAITTVGGGIGGFLGTLGAGIGLGIGPLINTYQREITGEPGFLDRMIKRMNDYNFAQMSRQELEKQMVYTL